MFVRLRVKFRFQLLLKLIDHMLSEPVVLYSNIWKEQCIANNTIDLSFVLCIVSLYGHYRDISDSDNIMVAHPGCPGDKLGHYKHNSVLTQCKK